MSDLLVTTVHSLFAWSVIALLLSWTLAAAYPLLDRWLQTASAPVASFFTLLYGLLPPASAVIALFLLFHPHIAVSLVRSHCHEDVCGPHEVHITTTTLAGLSSVALAIVLLGIVGILFFSQLMSGRQRLRMLDNLSEAGSPHYRLVETSNPVAWCAGLWRPQVYISRSLHRSLDDRQLNIVLAHEFSHACRRDNLRKWLLHWATIAWPRTLRQRIRRDFGDRNEQVGDLAALRENHSPWDLNSVIRTIEHHCPCADANSRRQRVAGLQRELALSAAGAGRRWLRHSPLVLQACCLWMLFIIVSVHFGHPLLEWLSR